MKKLLLWLTLLFPVLVNGQSWEIYTGNASVPISDNNGGLLYKEPIDEYWSSSRLVNLDRFGNKHILRNVGFGFALKIQTANGDIICQNYNSSKDAYTVLRMKQSGEVKWEKNGMAYSRVIEVDNGYLFAINSNTIEKFTPEWNLIFTKTYDFEINGLIEYSSDSYLIHGTSQTIPNTNIIVNMNNNGDSLSSVNIDISTYGSINNLKITPSNHFLAITSNGYLLRFSHELDLIEVNNLYSSNISIETVNDGYYLFYERYNFVKITKFNYSNITLWSKNFPNAWIGLDMFGNYNEGSVLLACSTFVDNNRNIFYRIDKDGTLHTGNISGKVNKDENQNCLVEAAEKGIGGILIKAEPGPLYSFTDSSGLYSLAVDTGKIHLVKPIGDLPYLHTYACENEKTILLNNGKADTSKINFYVRQEKCPALTVKINNYSYLKCFDGQLNISVSNYGKEKAENVSLSLALPSEIKVKSINKPYIFSGGNYLWSFGTIETGEEILVTIQDSIDCNAETGKRVVGKAVVTTSSTCSILNALTDTSYFSGVLRGSFDPNDKSVFPSAVNFSDYQLGKKELNYHINFQNTGTGPAYKVVVMDTLSDKLDFESIREIRTSHSSKINVVSTNPLVVAWVFDKINLPFKDENEPASHGFIDFVISLKDDLGNNTEIENRAAIYFDFNEPIITNTASVLISDEVDTESYIITSNQEADSKLSTISIVPNPMAEKSLFTLPKHIQLPAQFLLFSNEGKLIRREEVKQSEFILKRETLLPGIYHYVIQGTQQYFSGNILLK